MGFRQVTTAKSEKYGGSRRNREEAEAIIMWLQKKYEKILLCYSDKDGIEERGVLGIITPFKSQSFLMLELYIRFKGRSEKSFCFPVCMEVKMGVILLTEHRIL